MDFRFRFTASFVVAGIAIFAIAAILITRTARTNEESNLVSDISEQSTQNADLVAGAVNTFTDGTDIAGAPSDSATSLGFESMVMSTLMQSSNIVRLSLFDAEGALLWSSAENAAGNVTPDDSIFTTALNGEIATGLNRDVAFVNTDGNVSSGDLTSTYIPLVNQSNQQTTQVLEIAREVTGALDFRVESTRNSMMRTLFTTMGAAFAVLLGIVFTADTIINRSRRRAMAHEMAMNESKVEAERLELRNQQLEEISRERDKFLSMVSHELRTPLTSMLAFTEVLRRRQDGSNRDANLDHLEVMKKNGDHLNSLIEELLEVTEMHATEFEIRKERFSIQRLIDDVKDSADALVAPKGQRLRMDLQAGETELFADRKRMMQLLMNLLSNASAYSPEHTTITVNTRESGGTVLMSVTDQGEGISEEDQSRLFEEFYRGNSEITRSVSGLGLGLSIVKAIVDSHDGRVSVRSQPGSGTEVSVMIPVAGEEPTMDDAATEVA